MSFRNAGVLAQQAVDRWSWWRLALKDSAQIGKSLPVYPGAYELGYYRTRAKGGQWEPVGIWVDEDGHDVGYRNGRSVDDLVNLFHWSCRNPISYEAYVKASEGKGFDDEPPAPTIGDNSGDADPFEALRIELAGEIELADEFLKAPIKTQADADKAGIWAKRLGELSKRADGEREREKAPHLQACRDVDDKWRPVIGDAKDKAAALKRHVEPFLIAEKRKRDEEARKAREEAERLRREAEELAQSGVPEEADVVLEQARDLEEAAKVRNASAGRTGARVSVRVEKVGVVTDYAKAAVALVAMKHPDMLAEIDRLAKAAAKKNFPFDGMEIREEERVV